MNNLLCLSLFLAICQVVCGQDAPPLDKHYQNGVAMDIPLPGTAAIEYERLLASYFKKNSFSTGVSIEIGYDAGKLALPLGNNKEDLYLNPVHFGTSDYELSPFFKWYFGDPAKKIRPALMLKPSFLWLDPGGDFKNVYLFPSCEAQVMGTFSKKRFYVTLGIGIKQYLRYAKISYGEEETYFPAYKFDRDSEGEKPKRWRPASDFRIGWRF